MASPKPALLIIHGAYFLPETWQPFIDRMIARGFEVRCPRLPTCGDARPPTATLADDITAVRTAAKELRQAGFPIVVLCHSYGGVVATASITADLFAPEPRNQRSTGIVRIIYLCAHVPLPQSSLGDIFAEHGFLCDVKLEVNEDGTAFAQNAADCWYNDMPSAEREMYATKNVTHNFALIGDTKVESVPWKAIQSTYVFCEQDLAIKKPLQEAMIKDAIEAGGKWNTVTLDAAHCPFISVPDQVGDVVQQVWDAST